MKRSSKPIARLAFAIFAAASLSFAAHAADPFPSRLVKVEELFHPGTLESFKI